jgi:hypothetical protein
VLITEYLVWPSRWTPLLVLFFDAHFFCSVYCGYVPLVCLYYRVSTSISIFQLHQLLSCNMWSIVGIPVVPRNHAMVVNTFLWTILALVVVGLRIYTRAVLVKKVGYDDWLMLSAMVRNISSLTFIQWRR